MRFLTTQIAAIYSLDFRLISPSPRASASQCTTDLIKIKDWIGASPSFAFAVRPPAHNINIFIPVVAIDVWICKLYGQKRRHLDCRAYHVPVANISENFNISSIVCVCVRARPSPNNFPPWHCCTWMELRFICVFVGVFNSFSKFQYARTRCTCDLSHSVSIHLGRSRRPYHASLWHYFN